MKIEEIRPQMKVAYVPSHNPSAKEYGIVSSINSNYAFVRFDKQIVKFGWEGATSQACDPNMLTAAGD